jgi:hypothetical protein
LDCYCRKILAYCALTIPALKGNLVRPKKKNDMVPVTRVRVYLKPAVSKKFYGFCCGSAPYGWLTGGFKGVRRREWSKNKIFNKKKLPPCLLFQGHVTGTTPFFVLGLNRRSVPTMEHQRFY